MAIDDSDLSRLAAFFEATRDDLVWIGIDPGVTGAVAFVSARDHVVFDLPVVRVPTTRKRKSGDPAMRSEYDYAGIAALFSVVEAHAPARMRVALEKGSTRPGDTGLTSFVVGVGYGLWPLFLHRIGLATETVIPLTWKRSLGLAGRGVDKSAAKELSRVEAQKRFPRAILTAKAHHNRAEALLLAEYARLKGRGPEAVKKRTRREKTDHDGSDR